VFPLGEIEGLGKKALRTTRGRGDLINHNKIALHPFVEG